jgi:hypothetical protein
MVCGGAFILGPEPVGFAHGAKGAIWVLGPGSWVNRGADVFAAFLQNKVLNCKTRPLRAAGGNHIFCIP